MKQVVCVIVVLVLSLGLNVQTSHATPSVKSPKKYSCKDGLVVQKKRGKKAKPVSVEKLEDSLRAKLLRQSINSTSAKKVSKELESLLSAKQACAPISQIQPTPPISTPTPGAEDTQIPQSEVTPPIITTPFPAGVNVAAAKSVSFTVNPNYGLTTESTDTLNLTDEQGPNTSKMWTSTAAVGWSYVDTPIGIHIDLGEVHEVDTIEFITGGGAGFVYHPASIRTYSSLDGASWSPVGNLFSDAPSQWEYSDHTFSLAGLHRQARYIALYPIASGSILVCDEIKVVTGDASILPVSLPDDLLTTDELDDDALINLPLDTEVTASRYLIEAAREAIEATPGGDSSSALSALDAIESQLAEKTVAEDTGRSAGIPFTTIDRDITEIVGEYMSQAFSESLTLWQLSDGFFPAPFERPSSSAPTSITLNAMRGEVEQRSIILSNNENVDLTVSFSHTSSDVAVSYYKGQEVLTEGYRFIADALPKIENQIITIPPGITQEVVVSVDTTGASAGTKNITLTLTPTLGSAKTVNLTVTVYDLDMPENPEFLSGLFTYHSPDYNEEHFSEIISHLSSSHFNIMTLNSGEIPYPVQSKGVLVPPSFSSMNSVIAQYPSARFHVLYVGVVGTQIGALLDSELESDHQVFIDWVAALRDNMASLGITEEEWALSVVDEPIESELPYIEKASELMAELYPKPLLWQDWNSNYGVEEFFLSNPTVADIYSPTLSRFNSNTDALQSFFESLSQPAWMYDSTCARSRDPYQFLLDLWAAFDHNVAAYQKWGYLYGDPFNTVNGSIYSLAYPGDDGPITSRRFEAMRDGIEDVELLSQLKKKVGETGDPTLQLLLDSAPEQVRAATSDPSVRNAYRVAILASLAP